MLHSSLYRSANHITSFFLQYKDMGISCKISSETFHTFISLRHHSHHPAGLTVRIYVYTHQKYTSSPHPSKTPLNCIQSPFPIPRNFLVCFKICSERCVIKLRPRISQPTAQSNTRYHFMGTSHFHPTIT